MTDISFVLNAVADQKLCLRQNKNHRSEMRTRSFRRDYHTLTTHYSPYYFSSPSHNLKSPERSVLTIVSCLHGGFNFTNTLLLL